MFSWKTIWHWTNNWCICPQRRPSLLLLTFLIVLCVELRSCGLLPFQFGLSVGVILAQLLWAVMLVSLSGCSLADCTYPS